MAGSVLYLPPPAADLSGMAQRPQPLNLEELGTALVCGCESGEADRRTAVIGALMLISVMPPERATAILARYPLAAAEILKGLNDPLLDEVRVVLWNVTTAAIAASRVAP